VRRAAARGEPVPEELEAWIANVRERAYTATDADVGALRAAGYSEDQIFEATVAAAVGAGLARFDAGVAALR
jgi:alkylhydroperoxidase family enzyme